MDDTRAVIVIINASKGTAENNITHPLKKVLKSSTPITSLAPLYVEHNVPSGISATLFPAQNCMTIPIKRMIDPKIACAIVNL
jgi:hypothetical protein